MHGLVRWELAQRTEGPLGLGESGRWTRPRGMMWSRVLRNRPASGTPRQPRSPLGRWLISFVNCFLSFTAEPNRTGEELSNLYLSRLKFLFGIKTSQTRKLLFPRS